MFMQVWGKTWIPLIGENAMEHGAEDVNRPKLI